MKFFSATNARALLLLLSAATVLLAGCAANSKNKTPPPESPQSPEPLPPPVANSPQNIPEPPKPAEPASEIFAPGTPVNTPVTIPKHDFSEKTRESFYAENPRFAPAPAQPAELAPKKSDTSDAPPEESMVINWLNTVAEAQTAAALAGKDIAIVFMSDDANPWCRQLETEVLSRPAFALSANKNFVFVMIDAPASPCAEWDVRSFPTVILADAAGRPYAITGYRNLGAADYAAQIEKLRHIREQRDFYLDAAQNEIGTNRAMFLAQALRAMDDEIVLRHYAKEFGELKHLDPENGTGLVGDIEFMPKLNALRALVLGKIRNTGDYAGALKAVDDFIEQETPAGEHLQRALFLKLNIYGSAEKRDHAAVVELMNSIIAIDPKSEPGLTAVDVRARAQALLAGPRAMPARQ